MSGDETSEIHNFVVFSVIHLDSCCHCRMLTLRRRTWFWPISNRHRDMWCNVGPWRDSQHPILLNKISSEVPFYSILFWEKGTITKTPFHVGINFMDNWTMHDMSCNIVYMAQILLPSSKCTVIKATEKLTNTFPFEITNSLLLFFVENTNQVSSFNRQYFMSQRWWIHSLQWWIQIE